MKIAIIGCGYLGMAMAAFWKGCGHEITATTRKRDRFLELQSVANHVVILESNGLKKALEGQDVILIAVAPGAHDQYWDTYFKTTQEILQQRDSCTRRIFYISSTSVYGDHGGEIVDETTQPNPLSPNNQILLDTERLLDGTACVFRLGEIVGPERKISHRLRKIGSKMIPGNGHGFTNISFLGDIVKGLEFALQNSLRGLYNLVSDLHVPRRDLYTAICQHMDLPLPNWNPEVFNSHLGNKIVSNAKLKMAGFVFEAIPPISEL